jgi:hypothetical protein
MSLAGFLKPTKTKLLIFSFLILLAIGAKIQTYGFSDKTAPPPPFYDAIKDWPIWSFYILTALPVVALSSFLALGGLLPDFMYTEVALWLVLIPYYYVISAALAQFMLPVAAPKDTNLKSTKRQYK